MSNFDFMNQEQFLKHPACQKLYEFALLAEQYYRTDHEKCALKVRFALEQVCVFGSEFKHAVYPGRISMLGNYWCVENKLEFFRVFGLQNANYIMRANEISRSYFHIGIPTREDIYPEMLESLYKVLLWLYKELGFQTQEKYSDYDVNRIPSEKPRESDEKGEIFYSSQKMLDNFQKYFPNCNTKSLCNVEKQGEQYIVKDLEGNIIEEFILKEAYKLTEEEKTKIEKQLEKITSDFKSTQKRFLENEQTAEEYRKQISLLGEKYEALRRKYEELVPLEEQQGKLKQQIEELLKERKRLQREFLIKEKVLQEEVVETKKRLISLQQDLTDMRISSAESRELILHLERELSEKEKELSYIQNLSEKNYEKLQNETAQMISEYENKANNLEIILTNVMIENAKYKEMLSSYNHTSEITGYLQIVNKGIVQMKDSYMLYKQNPNEQKLRMYLLKVKAHYEEQIADLEKALKAKEKELEEEKQKNEHMRNVLWNEFSEGTFKQKNVLKNEPPKAVKSQKRKKKLEKILAASVLAMIAVLGALLMRETAKTEENKHSFLQEDLADASSEAGNLAETEKTSDVEVVREETEAEVVGETGNSETKAEDVREEVEGTEEKLEGVEEEVEGTEEKTEDVEEEVEGTEEKLEGVEEEVEGAETQPEDSETTMGGNETEISGENGEQVQQGKEQQENTQPSKLDELLAQREWANSRPATLVDIPGIDEGLKTFVLSETFVSDSTAFYETLELLGEADIYSVSNKDAKIYTSAQLEWMEFCWISSNRDADILIMYVEPNVISSTMNRNTTKSEIVKFLGEPTTQYSNVGWSDFNFFKNDETVLDYEWTYVMEEYEIHVRIFFCGEAIIDYCQVIIEC